MIREQEPEELACFDPHLMTRVLHHLLENAARYSLAGTQITVRFRRLGSRIEFEVEDKGTGIDPHDLPYIFDKFYRGRQQAITAKGSGMGLAIAKAILTAHGGGIEAKSTLGKGSVFRVWLPAAYEQQTQPGSQD